MTVRRIAGTLLLYARRLVGASLLLLGAINAFVAWTFTTCTQGSADSLYGGALTLPLFIAAWCFLARYNEHFVKVILIWTLPAILMLFVSVQTLRLIFGEPACLIITALPFEFDGRENAFKALWGGVCLLFWCGLFLSLKNAVRYGDVNESESR